MEARAAGWTPPAALLTYDMSLVGRLCVVGRVRTEYLAFVMSAPTERFRTGVLVDYATDFAVWARETGQEAELWAHAR